jgi:hypothetical protein
LDGCELLLVFSIFSVMFFTMSCIQINLSCLLRAPRRSQRHIAMMTRAQYDVRHYNPFMHLKPVTAFRQAPGGMLLDICHLQSILIAFLPAINKILQAPNMIAFCSAAVGGHPDDDDEPGNLF